MPDHIGRAVLNQEAQAILHLAARLDDGFDEAVRWLLECQGRVITCGVGKSGHIARKTAGTLSSTGTPSLFLHAAEAVHGDLGMVTANDIVLMYTHSGETDELVRLFPAIRSIGARTILITGRPDSSAGREADLILDTAVGEEACPNNLAPTTSTTVMLALSDALAISVMERRSFGKEDFAKFHPSGTLGKRLLLRVSDVMRKGSECAFVQPETPVLDVMQTISRAGAGVACVVSREGSLLGLISDGDLRRHFIEGANMQSDLAQAIMKAGAWTIEPDLLAFEALERFENLPKQIGDLPVVGNGKLLGVLTLKDLVRSGIV